MGGGAQTAPESVKASASQPDADIPMNMTCTQKERFAF